jgi:hypothetical protein
MAGGRRVISRILAAVAIILILVGSIFLAGGILGSGTCGGYVGCAYNNIAFFFAAVFLGLGLIAALIAFVNRPRPASMQPD